MTITTDGSADDALAQYLADEKAQFDREHAAIGDTGPAIAYPPTPTVWNDTGLRSHQRIAKRFATYAEGHALYVDGTGWHCWDGTRWARDVHAKRTHDLLEMMLNISWGEALADKSLQADVKASMSSHGSAGVLDLASRKLFAPETDTDPWKLNCANGTLDLHTLELHPADPADLITKRARAAYVPGAQSDRWDNFLASSLPDTEVRGFLQRYAGVGLIGRVLEHVLVVATGEGRNGKGILANALSHALGNYAITASNDLLVASRYGGKSAGELAQMMQLRGARWAVMSELERDAKLAESTMKSLTSSDPVNAKSMGQNPINFPPSHSFIMLTNHLPSVDPRAQAVWARMRVVPFDVSFEGREDLTLEMDLETQLEAILAWAVEGLRQYRADGRLVTPERVKATTERYRDENDVLTRFISEECVLIDSGEVRKSDLADAYSRWAMANKKESLTQAAVGNQIKHLIENRPETYGSLTPGRTGAGETWRGIRLLEPRTAETP